MTGQEELFDRRCVVENSDDPRREWLHITLPSVAYVCGGSILGLADGGPAGTSLLGVGPTSPASWSEITCPGCAAPGRREVARIQHRQQRPIDHVCGEGCTWTQIPESEEK